MATIGDLDNNGTPDLAVGARHDDDGGNDEFADRGAVWVLFLKSSGTVKNSQKISFDAGGFNGGLVDGSRFGNSVSTIGDLDSNGVPDLAVGTDSTFGADKPQGSFWVLHLNSDGTVKNQQENSASTGGFAGSLGDQDNFGFSVAGMGDLDGDDIDDVAAGSPFDEGDGVGGGATWILYLNADGTVAREQKISDTKGGFGGALPAEDRFGSSLARVAHLNGDTLPHTGDVDGNGVPELAVGATHDEDGPDAGATWMLFGGTARLPVEMASFDGTRTGERTVRLTWRTASETNNAGFAVQWRIEEEERAAARLKVHPGRVSVR